MDIITFYQNIRLVKEQLKTLRDNTDKVFEEDVWTRATKLATITDIELTSPSVCGRMTRRTNIPSTTPQQYYKLAVLIPPTDHLISELEFRFLNTAVYKSKLHVICTLYHSTFSFFEWALSSPETFNQEIDIWKTRWQGQVIIMTQNLTKSLDSCDYKLFPNVYTCLHLLLIIPVSNAATEHSHSCLKIVKSKLQSNMGKERLNALVLSYVHKDIVLDYKKVIDIYTNRYARRMRFLNPAKEDN